MKLTLTTQIKYIAPTTSASSAIPARRIRNIIATLERGFWMGKFGE